MIQHTPGPWTVLDTAGDPVILAVGAKTLARVYNRQNAHLIAAAPEMYALLHHLVEGDNRVYAKLSAHAREHFEARRDPNRLADQARALLARIEGR